MLLSDKTIDLLDDGKLTELIDGAEFSRKTFLKGGGALVVGFSLVGVGARRLGQGRVGARVAAGPPNAALIDSWITIHADNTATLCVRQDRHHGHAHRPAADRGRGARPDDPAGPGCAPWTPTSRRTRASRPAATRSPTGGPQVRQAAAEARAVLLGLAADAARRPGLAADGRQRRRLRGRRVEDRHLRRAARRQAVLRSEHRPGAAEAGHRVQARRQAGPADRHAGEGATGTHPYVHNLRLPGMLHGRVVRPRGQGPYGVDRQAALGRRELDQEHHGRPRSSARATSSASSPRTSRTRSRRRRS